MKAAATQTNAGNERKTPLPTRYTEIEIKEERPRPRTSNTNGGLNLVYIRDWRNESIGVIKKALRIEIGQTTGDSASNKGNQQRDDPWPDVNAVRHINQYGTPTSPLLEIACTPDKTDVFRNFFNGQGIEICEGDLNPCIDPAIMVNNETDNKKLAKRLKNHFVRLLLSWWKAAHYVYSPDTRLFYRRSLLQLISGSGNLFEWPAFVTAVHIDASNVSSRKDSPRIWFQYKAGYEFLDEDETNRKAAVSVQSFSTASQVTPTPASKVRRQSGQDQTGDKGTTPVALAQQTQPTQPANGDEVNDVARTLYATPASTCRNVNLVNQFVDGHIGDIDDETERNTILQITNSNKQPALVDPGAWWTVQGQGHND